MKKSIKYIIIAICIILIILLLYWFNKFYTIHKIENNLTKISSLDNYSCTIRYNNTLVNDNDFTKYTSVNKMKFIEDSTGIKMAKYSDIEGYSFNNDTKEYLKLSRIEDIDNQFEDSIFQNFKYAFNENGKNEQSYIYQFKLALKMKVKSEKYNGKECYAISYKNEDGYKLTLYIDKKELVKVAEKVDNEDSIVYEWNFNIQNENNYNKEILLNEYTSIN